MSKLDVYNITDKLGDAMLDVMVTRLEARGKHAFFQRMLADYLDAMKIDISRNVLDMGCGTGVAARAIAARPDFSGEVLGIDLSPYLAQVAKRLAAEDGVGGRTQFRAGDTRSLEIADATFDAVVAHTLFSHVADPAAVLGEAARVVKPGGMIGVFDGDYASLTFGQDDPDKAKEDDERVIDAVVTQPRVMRQLPALVKRAGLELVQTFPYILAETGRADFWVPALESFRALLPRAGAMTETEAQAWVDAQLAASDEGVFFGASNYYGYVLRRPWTDLTMYSYHELFR